MPQLHYWVDAVQHREGRLSHAVVFFTGGFRCALGRRTKLRS